MVSETSLMEMVTKIRKNGDENAYMRRRHVLIRIFSTSISNDMPADLRKSASRDIFLHLARHLYRGRVQQRWA